MNLEHFKSASESGLEEFAKRNKPDFNINNLPYKLEELRNFCILISLENELDGINKNIIHEIPKWSEKSKLSFNEAIEHNKELSEEDKKYSTNEFSKCLDSIKQEVIKIKGEELIVNPGATAFTLSTSIIDRFLSFENILESKGSNLISTVLRIGAPMIISSLLLINPIFAISSAIGVAAIGAGILAYRYYKKKKMDEHFTKTQQMERSLEKSKVLHKLYKQSTVYYDFCTSIGLKTKYFAKLGLTSKRMDKFIEKLRKNHEKNGNLGKAFVKICNLANKFIPENEEKISNFFVSFKKSITQKYNSHGATLELQANVNKVIREEEIKALKHVKTVLRSDRDLKRKLEVIQESVNNFKNASKRIILELPDKYPDQEDAIKKISSDIINTENKPIKRVINKLQKGMNYLNLALEAESPKIHEKMGNKADDIAKKIEEVLKKEKMSIKNLQKEEDTFLDKIHTREKEMESIKKSIDEGYEKEKKHSEKRFNLKPSKTNKLPSNSKSATIRR